MGATAPIFSMPSNIPLEGIEKMLKLTRKLKRYDTLDFCSRGQKMGRLCTLFWLRMNAKRNNRSEEKCYAVYIK